MEQNRILSGFYLQVLLIVLGRIRQVREKRKLNCDYLTKKITGIMISCFCKLIQWLKTLWLNYKSIRIEKRWLFIGSILLNRLKIVSIYMVSQKDVVIKRMRLLMRQLKFAGLGNLILSVFGNRNQDKYIQNRFSEYNIFYSNGEQKLFEIQ